MKNMILIISACFVLATLNTVQAQDENRVFLKVTYKTIMPEGGSAAERDSLLSIFVESVTRKNDKVLSSKSMQHTYGPDSRDWIVLNEYANWADIKAARTAADKLIEEAWPDESERSAFFKELFKYWLPRHGDEVYTEHAKLIKRAPQMAGTSAENHIFGITTYKTTFTDEGSRAIRDSLLSLTHEAVVMKNDKIISRRILSHTYGMDSRDWIVVTEYANEAAVEEARLASRDLRRAAWPDQEQRRAFFTELRKYWLPQHSDQIYTGLSKFEKSPAQITAK